MHFCHNLWNFPSFVNKINANYGIIITYRNSNSVEWLIIAIDGVKHHGTRDWSDIMNREPRDVVVIPFSIPIDDEMVIIEIAVLRGGVTSCDKPWKCARYGRVYETWVEEYYVVILSIIPDVVSSSSQSIPSVYGCDIVCVGVSYTANYISIKLERKTSRMINLVYLLPRIIRVRSSCAHTYMYLRACTDIHDIEHMTAIIKSSYVTYLRNTLDF